MKNKPISNTLLQAVKHLNANDWISGDHMGQQLGISRAAVWKLITLLKNYGIKIDSHKAKGYRMTSPLYLLEEEKIREALTINQENLHFELFESMPSTNDYLMQKSTFDSNPTVCACELQEMGKGRLGRTWQSPFGQNIYLSYLWTFQQDFSALMGLSLVVGISVLKALEGIGLKDLKIKWPNDVYCHAKKIAGVLIEIRAESNSATRVVIGTGLNVNMLEAEEINQNWTSCQAELGNPVDRNELISLYLNELTTSLAKFEKEGLTVFMDEWDQFDFLKGQQIVLENQKQLYHGQVMGINESGALLLNTGETVRPFNAGDTSIQKRS